MNDNSARRLHKILEEMRNYYLTSPEVITTRSVLGNVLESTDFSEYKTNELWYETHRLLHKIITDIETLDLDEELYKKPVQRLFLNLLNISLDNLWRDERKKLDAADIRTLLHCSKELSNHKTTPVYTVEGSELTELIEEVENLYQAVSNTKNLPDDVQAIILDQLDIIRRAFHDYRFKGISSLREALERNIGNSILHVEKFNQTNQQPEINRYKAVLSRLLNIVSKADKAVTIAEKVQKLLNPFTGGDQ